MLITDKTHLKELFRNAATTKYNRADQFFIIPIVPNLMGYSEEIKKVYGADLLDGDNHKSLNDKSVFNAGDIVGDDIDAFF